MKEFTLPSEGKEILQEAFYFIKKAMEQADSLRDDVVWEERATELYENTVEAYVLVNTLLDKMK